MKLFQFKDNKQKEKWTETRNKGFIRFFVVYGLLMLGGIFTVGTILLSIVWDYMFNAERYHDRSFFLNKVIGGFLFGSIMGLYFWFGSEWAYKKSEVELEES